MANATIDIDNKIETLLKQNSMSVTDSRKKILKLFLDQAGALAHGDIEKKAGEKFDYSAEHVEVVVEGICKNCKDR